MKKVGVFMRSEPIRRTMMMNNIIVKRSMMNSIGSPHSHDFFELSLCLDGHVEHKINGKSYDFKPGDILLLTPTDFHYEHAYETTNTLQIHFRENMLDESIINMFLNYGSEMVFRFDAKTTANMKSLMLLLLEEYESNGENKDEYLRKLFGCLMLLFIRAANLNKKKLKEVSPLQKTMMYAHMHFRESPTLEEASKVCNMSKTYFCSAFRKYTGIGFVKYVNNLKLNYARKLIISTTLSITEVCYRSGFNSESNFLRAFKQEFGMSAQKYRVMNKAAN